MLEPNRNYVIEDDGSIHKMLFSGDADWEERATTSIQEIRAKVIDDFVKKIDKHVFEEKTEEQYSNSVSFMREIKQIAEQMKDGAG